MTVTIAKYQRSNGHSIQQLRPVRRACWLWFLLPFRHTRPESNILSWSIACSPNSPGRKATGQQGGGRVLAQTGVIDRPLKRQVAIRRDGDDFVISFQPEDLIVFRHAEARALRKACVFLRWEVVSDTVPQANDLASW
jgi:hypothetical protein